MTVTTVDLARLLDERIKTYLAGSRAAKPTGSPTKSATASDKDGSTAAIKALLQELAKPKAQWDRTAIENLVCAAKQGELISKAEVFLNLNAGLGTDWDTASYDFPGVMLEEKSNDGQTAIVLMTGTRGIKTAAGPVAGSSKPLKAAITLVKEGGAWKVCSDFFN